MINELQNFFFKFNKKKQNLIKKKRGIKKWLKSI